jgi:hypothetical protein
MPVEAIEKVLMVLFLVALAVFLARLIRLRIQDRYPLFVISNGLDMVFGVTTVVLGTGARSVVNVDLVGLVISASLTPFVAFELYRASRADDHLSLRFLAPLVAAMLAGSIVTGYLGTGPDEESLKDVWGGAYIFDTAVTLGVLGFLVGKLRRGAIPRTPRGMILAATPVDHNLSWMRRLFVFEIASSGVLNLLEALVPAKFEMIYLVYVGLSFVVMAVCAVALRKQREATPA